MARNRFSLLIAAAACTALLAAPALAQTAKPMGNTPMDQGKMSMGKGGKMAAKKTARHKKSCYDYAWESQDMKDCLAKQSSQPAAPAKKSVKKPPAKKT